MTRITIDDVTEVLMENNSRMLERARRILRSDSEAEDVVQDVVLALLNAPHLLAGVERVSGWLLTIVYRKCIDVIRREKRRDEWVSEDIIAALFSRKDVENSTDYELMQTICDEIGKLPDEQRYVILANVLEGLSFEEISKRTGVRVGTLRVRKKRGLDTVRSRLSERGFGNLDDGRSEK